MKKIFFFVSCLVVVLSGCYKERYVEVYKPLDENLKYGATYKSGSYFIYRDSISGVTDSFYTTAGTQSKRVNIGGGNITDEFTTNFTNGNNIEMTIYTTCCELKCRFEDKNTGFITGGFLLVGFLKKLDSLQVQNKTYYDITYHDYFEKHIVFFSKNVGVVKYFYQDQNDSTKTITKELIRYSSLK